MTPDPRGGRATAEQQAGHDQAASARLRVALSGSSILPSDTSIRYAALVGMVFATTIVTYLRLWLDHLDSSAGYQDCMARLTELVQPLMLAGSPAERARQPVADAMRCGKPYATTALVWALVGVVAVTVVAAVIYWVMPWWRIWRRRLQPLARVRSADLHADLDRMVERMGLASRPTFWLGPETSGQGVAFGRQGRCHVQLNAGLIKHYRTDRPAVTAVVMHELAHIRNRDIRYTYLTVSTWWAFVAVALLPYVVTAMLPLVLGGYPQWWPAAVRASSINGRVAVSLLAMTVLIYLNYAGILRVRERHADATAASVAGADALTRVLDRSRSTDRAASGFRRRIWPAGRGSAILRKHPPVEQRLAVLRDPSPLYATGTAAMFGAGIAIAEVQANLTKLTLQVLIVSASGPGMRLGHVHLMAVSLLNYGVSAWLIAALAFVTMWRARLWTYVEPSPRPSSPGWLRPAVALTAGLLVGESLSVFFSGAHAWGVFDGAGMGGAGVAGLFGAVVSVAALIFGTAVLFAWMSESAAVWIPVIRGSLPRVGLVASLLGALAFTPAYASWSWLHDLGAATTRLNYGDQLAWGLPWKPPGMSLVYAEYLPIFVFGTMLPSFGLILVLPCLFLIGGALRRPSPLRPRWLYAATPDPDMTISPTRPRAQIGAAMWTGLVASLACLAVSLGLATLVWARTGGSHAPDRGSVIAYLTFATVTLAVAFSAVSAAVVVARTRQVAGTLAVLAAFVTTGVVAILGPLVPGVGMCGPARVLTSAGCRRFMTSMAPTTYGVMADLAVPRAVLAACLAAAAIAAVSRLTHVPRRPAQVETPDPTDTGQAPRFRLRRTVLAALIGAVIANLALGGYFGLGLLPGM